MGNISKFLSRRHPVPLPRLRQHESGFTLPELLVSTIIFALLAGITAAVMIGQLLQGRQLEQAQRVRENFSRLNYLIQVEASEASEIISTPERRTVSGGGSNPCPSMNNLTGFTLYVPNPTLDYGAKTRNDLIPIAYYNLNGNINRCGPDVFRNGRLILVDQNGNLARPRAGIVLPAASFVGNSIVLSAGGLTIDYEVNFSTGNFGTAGLGRVARAHAKSVFVCNPPIGNQPSRVGEC